MKLASTILLLSKITSVSPFAFVNENKPNLTFEEKMKTLQDHPNLMETIIGFANNHKISPASAFAILSAAAATLKDKCTDVDVVIDYVESNPVVFIDEMVKRIDVTDNEQENTYHSDIPASNINCTTPHLVLGPSISEDDIRDKPTKYFEQDENGYVYIKDASNTRHCAGKFFIHSLDGLRNSSQNISRSDGKLIFVYGNESLLDSCNCLNSKKFDLANVASNHNGIETISKDDFEKTFSEYPNDHTQGPAIMMGFPFSSFVLLHLLNGKKVDGHTSPLKSCEMFQVMSSKDSDKGPSYELNLLKGFGISTSAGYINYDSLKGKSFKNDKNFRVLTVEDAPLSLKKNDKLYEFQKNPHKMTLFIAAAIPNEGSYGSNASKSQVKKYLKMYYESLFRCCKLKEIKNALITPIGIGVFGIPIEWHLEILNNMQDLVKQSGSTYWINGYNANYDKYENKYKKIKFKNIDNLKSIDEMMLIAKK